VIFSSHWSYSWVLQTSFCGYHTISHYDQRFSQTSNVKKHWQDMQHPRSPCAADLVPRAPSKPTTFLQQPWQYVQSTRDTAAVGAALALRAGCNHFPDCKSCRYSIRINMRCKHHH
jgi:hypothetical protein